MRDFQEFLRHHQVVPAELLDQLDDSDTTGEPVYYNLLRRKPELEGPLWRALAEFVDTELVDPDEVKDAEKLAQWLPARIAHELAIVPIGRKGACLQIALADPRQFEKCDEIAMLLARQGAYQDRPDAPVTVAGQLARPSDVAKMIRRIYGIGADTVEDVLKHEQAAEQSAGPAVLDLTTTEEDGDEAAIIRFVNQLLREAVQINASDIHLEPYENELRVRYRVDGMLQTEPVPARIKKLEAAIISRVKIMANMDIAEKRLPLDGQIRLMVMGRPIDVRVSILPTIFGQGLALRLLDRQIAFRSLDNLGMPGDYLELYRDALHLSHGVILVTGPTGSGKTTTLYGSINEIAASTRKIVTVEDPVEYQLEGVSQIQVKDGIGLTFGRVLRHILRHDPDVIMVGEIRDTETARIAISAAMTGHLVFSTLHTNDAPSAPVRLLEMGVEPYLVSSSLEAVIAQRLVRLLCHACRRPMRLADNLAAKDRQVLQDGQIYEATGCEKCRQSGYIGRLGIFEMFTLNDEIRNLILNRRDAQAIRDAAAKLGMRTLRQTGMVQAAQGETSLAEVLRITRDETIDMQERLSTT